jgi:hypothetical protein
MRWGGLQTTANAMESSQTIFLRHKLKEDGKCVFSFTVKYNIPRLNLLLQSLVKEFIEIIKRL